MTVSSLVVSAFNRLKAEMHEKYPFTHEEALSLAEDIVDPTTSSVSRCWDNVWRKPLYAHTKVEIANVAIEKLKPWMNSSWADWGTPSSRFRIEYAGRKDKKDEFRIVGDLSQEIRDKTNIALHRLYAIQGGANAMRHRFYKERLPFRDIVGVDLRDAVPALQKELGRGWGPITVLHMLTDFGCAVKPDLHLMRAIKALGLHDSRHNVPPLNEAILVNEKVKALTESVMGSLTPQNLRYVDKTLMDMSMSKLISTLEPV